QVPELAGFYFLVTGSGKYFRNMKEQPEKGFVIIRISRDGTYAELLWGFSEGGMPTSELPAHLMSHMVRLKKDPEHRLTMDTQATNVIAMTVTHELKEKEFSIALWKMCTECIVVVPERVAILPSMLTGADVIVGDPAKKMHDYRSV